MRKKTDAAVVTESRCPGDATKTLQALGQKGFHARTLEEYAMEQPEIIRLQEILLSIGGDRLIANILIRVFRFPIFN